MKSGSSRQTLSKKKKRDQHEWDKERLSSFQHSYMLLLDTLLGKTPYEDDAPTLSAIVPLIETTLLRVTIGSHREKLKNGKKTYHQELDIDVPVEAGCCICFLSDATIHSGAPSDGKKCTRFFYIFDHKEKVTALENQNYSSALKSCERSCKTCTKILKLKGKNDGCLIPFLTTDEIINLFNIKDHGFCVLRFQSTQKRSYKNGVTNKVWIIENGLDMHMKFEDKQKKNISFTSIGQEEQRSRDGKRLILENKGSCIQQFLDRQVSGNLKDYLLLAERKIVSHVNAVFPGCTYEPKGRTILKNEGIIGYQNVHLDKKPLT